MGKEIGKTEISYVEYKKALITVELFYAQINKKYTVIKNEETKTNLRTWIINTKMGGRLRNILIDLNTEYVRTNQMEFPIIYFEYLEDISKGYFLRAKNAGKKSWLDFEKLRNNIS